MLVITSNGAVMPDGRAVDITDAAVEVAAEDIAGEDLLTVESDNSEPDGKVLAVGTIRDCRRQVHRYLFLRGGF